MTNPIQLNGGSYSSGEIIAAIAASNDPTIDLSQVNEKLDYLIATYANLHTKLNAIEAQLLTLPTSWSIS